MAPPPGLIVARGNDQAADPVLHQFRHAADAGDDGGHALGHGLDGGLGQAFLLDRGHHEEVARAGQAGGVRAEAGEADAGGDGGDLGEAGYLRVADFADQEEVQPESAGRRSIARSSTSPPLTGGRC
ncbi:MAG: hypothetical protein U1G05_11530 [Kiritimatiellia bacterium]